MDNQVMLKRRLLLLLAVGVLAGLALPMLDAPPKSGVPPADFWRLRPGMSREEVEAIIGRPSPSPLLLGAVEPYPAF
jgi:hypothetical protein